jgi:hypothetical protein
MITPSTFNDLHAARKASCTCNTIMATPFFHRDDCPYRGKGEAVLAAAEAEVEVDE